MTTHIFCQPNSYQLRYNIVNQIFGETVPSLKKVEGISSTVHVSTDFFRIPAMISKKRQITAKRFFFIGCIMRIKHIVVLTINIRLPGFLEGNSFQKKTNKNSVYNTI